MGPITIEAFERCEIAREAWTHRAHLTVAYLYLREHGLEGATDRMRRGIRALNAALKVPEAIDSGYHETLTVAWLRILDAMMQTHGPGAGPDEFLDAQPYLLNRLLLRLYYSRGRIMSERAKREFVEPDLGVLPRVPGGG
ncbi:MAG: hypothetical protein IT431_10805 [Phycisphaerales bacterium]|nr:hypothetical protein [Phycisphaerales bacterium]